MARQQLGTVGSGNHYVDIFNDEDDRIWIGVHFGSRGLGHKTATMTVDQYGHLFPDDLDDVADKMDDLVSRCAQNVPTQFHD
jgi:tRNA-splicing ligase RtcB